MANRQELITTKQSSLDALKRVTAKFKSKTGYAMSEIEAKFLSHLNHGIAEQTKELKQIMEGTYVRNGRNK